jgi:FkbM family methyltransferase
MTARQAAKRLAKKAGFEITRIRTVDAGQDASQDIKTFLRDTPRPTILDVGANVGQSVLRFRELLPDCRLHCFEPGQSSFRELTRNTAGLGDIHLNQVAVGGTPGVRRFLENSDPRTSSFLPIGVEGTGTVERETDVPVITLDDYCSENAVERVDLLKSDTQGYDLEVLRGADGLFRTGRVGLVYVEIIFSPLYEDLPSLDVLYRFLRDREMRLVALYDYVMSDGVAAWCDGLFAARRHV